MNAEPEFETPGLVPDRAEAEKLVRMLAASVAASVTFQTFTDPKGWREKKIDGDGRPWPKRSDGKQHDPLARVIHGTLAANWNELVRLNRAGAGVYVMVNQGDGRGRGNENVRNGGALRALFLDDDTGELSLTALEVIEPSIAVQSRRGLQPYWRLRPGEKLEHFRAAQEALAARFGSDPSIKDLARVMRLPGFFHQKDRAEPFPVRVVQVKDVAYSIAEVLDGFGIEIAPPRVRERQSTNGATRRNTHEQRFIDRQIAKARREIESAKIGERNSVLASWAYTLGGFVGGRYLARSVAAAELAAASSRVGLEESEFQDVIDRQLDAGAKAPLDVPAADEPPPPESENPKSATTGRSGEPYIKPVLTRMSTIAARPVRWLWPGRIAFGKFTMIDGDPGNLKSTLALDIAARLTRGLPMPGEDKATCGPVRAMIVSAEDDAGDTIRPRLEAAGADLDLVELFTMQIGDEKDLLPVLSEHMAYFASALEESGSKFLMLDPLAALLGSKIDMWKDQDVRRVLGPLKNVLERTGAASAGIRHLNKAHAGKSALYAGGGSIGIAGAGRSVLCVGRDPQNPVQRVLALVKSNNAEVHEVPSLAYHCEKMQLGEVETIRLVWDGPSAYTADELLAAQVPDSSDDRTALDDAKALIVEVLRNGPVLTKELQKQAKAADVASRTLNRARAALGVRWKWTPQGIVCFLPDRSSSPVGTVGDPLEEDG